MSCPGWRATRGALSQSVKVAATSPTGLTLATGEGPGDPGRRACADRSLEACVCVAIGMSVAPRAKQVDQARSAIRYLTDEKQRVRLTCPRDALKQVLAQFTIPKAGQCDAVDRIARAFWNVDDYGTCTIWFPKPVRSVRRRVGRGSGPSA